MRMWAASHHRLEVSSRGIETEPSVQSQRHREPEQEQLQADAHFEVAPER